MHKFVLSLVVISLEAIRLRRQSEASPSGGLGGASADNGADTVVAACTAGALDFTGAAGAAPMPEALMSAFVNYAAGAYRNEVQYALDKFVRCWQFTSQGSIYTSDVKKNLIEVYRLIIYPMIYVCEDWDFKYRLNCAWTQFVRKSLGLWNAMVGWTAGDFQGHIKYAQECEEVVADIVSLYKKVFDQAWVTAHEFRDQLSLQGNRPAPYYTAILEPFWTTLMGNGHNVDKEPGFWSIRSRLPALQLLTQVCKEFGCWYSDLESEFAGLRREAKNIR